jgi:hypothetical protein
MAYKVIETEIITDERELVNITGLNVAESFNIPQDEIIVNNDPLRLRDDGLVEKIRQGIYLYEEDHSQTLSVVGGSITSVKFLTTELEIISINEYRFVSAAIVNTNQVRLYLGNYDHVSGSISVLDTETLPSSHLIDDDEKLFLHRINYSLVEGASDRFWQLIYLNTLGKITVSLFKTNQDTLEYHGTPIGDVDTTPETGYPASLDYNSNIPPGGQNITGEGEAPTADQILFVLPSRQYVSERTVIFYRNGTNIWTASILVSPWSGTPTDTWYFYVAFGPRLPYPQHEKYWTADYPLLSGVSEDKSENTFSATWIFGVSNMGSDNSMGIYPFDPVANPANSYFPGNLKKENLHFSEYFFIARKSYFQLVAGTVQIGKSSPIDTTDMPAVYEGYGWERGIRQAILTSNIKTPANPKGKIGLSDIKSYQTWASYANMSNTGRYTPPIFAIIETVDNNDNPYLARLPINIIGYGNQDWRKGIFERRPSYSWTNVAPLISLGGITHLNLEHSYDGIWDTTFNTSVREPWTFTTESPQYWPTNPESALEFFFSCTVATKSKIDPKKIHLMDITHIDGNITSRVDEPFLNPRNGDYEINHLDIKWEKYGVSERTGKLFISLGNLTSSNAQNISLSAIKENYQDLESFIGIAASSGDNVINKVYVNTLYRIANEYTENGPPGQTIIVDDSGFIHFNFSDEFDFTSKTGALGREIGYLINKTDIFVTMFPKKHDYT